MSLAEYPQLHTESEEGGKQVCVCGCSVALITLITAVREWKVPGCSDFSRFSFLARRPVVAHAQFGPGDYHLVHARGAHFWREMDDATFILHILEFVLLEGLHVDH